MAEVTQDLTLVVDELTVIGSRSGVAIIEDVTLHAKSGEILGVVGESGSGKTTLGLDLLGYCKNGTETATGTVIVDGTAITGVGKSEIRQIRGRTIAYIPQSPASALNPALRIRTQLMEAVPESAKDGVARVREVLREVELPDTDEFLARFPHQLSGGQQQRVVLAMAFIPRPNVLVLDEPTTGLDVTTQKYVLDTVRSMTEHYGCSAVYISHDLTVVSELADRIIVMYAGRIVESGLAADVIGNPQHPYTVRLLMAVPDLEARRPMIGIRGHAPSPLSRPSGCSFAPRCPIAIDKCSIQPPVVESKNGHLTECWRSGDPVPIPEMAPAVQVDTSGADEVLVVKGLQVAYGRQLVLESIDLSVVRGECLALLGESGSGKTTLARAIAGLVPARAGEARLDGERLAHGAARRSRSQLRRLQYVFQNPYEALNPRRKVRDLVLDPAVVLGVDVRDRAAFVAQALERASLRSDYGCRYPHQLSGGERQRVALARSLASQPEVLICDEITSALDVSVQSSVVALLRGLQRELGLTLIFITHDIALVRNIADRVAILKEGRIVESGAVEDVFASPKHDYTRSLIDATPTMAIADAGGEC